MVTGRCRPFPPVRAFNFYRAYGAIPLLVNFFHRVLLTHALAFSTSQFAHKKKSQRIYTSMLSAGLELTKLTYTRLEDNRIRHQGDRLLPQYGGTRTWQAAWFLRQDGQASHPRVVSCTGYSTGSTGHQSTTKRAKPEKKICG